MTTTPSLSPDPANPRPSGDSSAGNAAGDTVPFFRAQTAAERVDVLAVEARTLRERLIVARARAEALQRKAKVQGEDLEKYRQALAGATEALRRQQNLAASYPLHVGGILAERGRWLAAEYRRRGPAGRLRLADRIGELLDLYAALAAAAQPPDDWPAVKAELEAARASGWHRRLLGRLRRGLARIARPLRKAA